VRALIPYLAYSYVTLVGLTTRFRFRGQEHRDRLRAANRRFIYAFWHQRQVIFTWTHRGDPADTLVSRSKDGELIARTMELSRMGAKRGSSTRGGAVAARELIESVESGRDIAITPDGPKGPAREVKDGVIFLAQKLGVPILPLSCALSRRVEFAKAWDKFQVPLPFGRAVIRYAEPIAVGPHDDAKAKAAELKAALDRITQEAERELEDWGK
jgi:lysophospholipid acyltransferase (LPLAT)-like uncharacterized protein